jgi:hypothetical protein
MGQGYDKTGTVQSGRTRLRYGFSALRVAYIRKKRRQREKEEEKVDIGRFDFPPSLPVGASYVAPLV